MTNGLQDMADEQSYWVTRYTLYNTTMTIFYSNHL